MSSTRSFRRIVLLAVPWFFAGASPAVEAKPFCGVRSIEGGYGYVVNGTNVGSGPVSAVGLTDADGSGNLTATDTVSANGTVVRRTITGSYTVNANCTGSVVFTDNFGQTTHLDFVLEDNLRQFHFIQTDPGTVTTGIGTKQ